MEYQQDAFEKAWADYYKAGQATGWEKVGFTNGFGAGWKAAMTLVNLHPFGVIQQGGEDGK